MPTTRSLAALTALVLALNLVPAAAAADPAPLLRFNGKDLTGFYTYLHDHKYEDPDKVFTVVDGVLQISGKEWGGVVTREEYSNYRLIAEFRWGTKTWPPRVENARDSGVLLHCFGGDSVISGHWMQSMECQLIEGGTGDLLVVAQPEGTRMSLTSEVRKGEDGQWYYQPDGAGAVVRTFNGGRINWWGRDPAWKDVVGYRGPKDVEKPLGEWNTLEVVCDGDSITNILNGKVVNVGVKSSVTKGKLTFQSEGAEVHFRKIEILPLVKK
ncbi:3-keto-disaccharide hydrolase [Paludisphaera mucosa]|uniref:DUF1080 domain-containing protein n=1 Tax=Paludisphaera mucosa TaxID=3030827 RepID=A0ABT6FA42_9BACT|nr:DUF1080 domain-containing protein [Paludisphaera mucosa]MDG3004424.1 DUF1080 domain-containing protein [Paludisphaera mucosa]